MALTVVQHVTNSTGSTTALVTTVTATGSGNLLVCVVNGSGIPTSVTDGTTNFQSFPDPNGGSGRWYGSGNIYYLQKSQSGKTTITVNYGSASNVDFELWEVSGFTNPVPDTGTFLSSGSQSAGKATGSSVITYVPGFLVAFDKTNSAATNVGNGFNSGGDQDLNGNCFCSLITTTGGTYTPVWTDTGSSFNSLTAAFREGGVLRTTAWRGDL